jgi:hypothetical protein
VFRHKRPDTKSHRVGSSHKVERGTTQFPLLTGISFDFVRISAGFLIWIFKTP